LKTFILILLLLIPTRIQCQDIFFENPEDSVKKNDIVAEIGNIKITAEEFIYGYEFGPAFPKRNADSKKKYLNYMINEKLLALDGYEKNIMEKEEAKEAYDNIKSDLATEEMFNKEIVPEVKINDAEIKKVIETKQKEYQLRWLYANELDRLEYYLRNLKNGITFDSLFNTQLNDSVLIDDRQLKSSLYNIYIKNSQFAQIIDTLNPGKISDPIHTDDGWYIIKIDNILKNLITSESEHEKLKFESKEAITKSKLDILSNQYIKELFSEEAPVIKRNVFNVLRSYLGKFLLTPEKYSEWELDNKLNNSLANLRLKSEDKYSGLALVECKSMNISLDEFIIWYRNREQYVNLLKNDLVAFSKSLEDFIWLMIRDKLLSAKAYQKDYDKSGWVLKQEKWWKDKISYSAYRYELANSIILNSEEVRLMNEKKKSESEIRSDELSKKILHKILELKKKYKVIINEGVLSGIKVSSENDKTTVNMYIVKRGNLFPRPAFPSIDSDWASWE
jgi:hypothetical protein